MSTHATERKIPLILIAVGLVLYAVGAMIHRSADGFLGLLVGLVIFGIIQTFLLIVAAFILAAVLKVNFGDFKSAMLKFAGAVFISAGLGAILPVYGLVGTFVFLGLLFWLFELEVPYAIALVVVYFLITLPIRFALAASFK